MVLVWRIMDGLPNSPNSPPAKLSRYTVWWLLWSAPDNNGLMTLPVAKYRGCICTMTISDREANEIKKATTTQHDSVLWREQQNQQLTVSVFHDVYVPANNPEPLIKWIMAYSVWVKWPQSYFSHQPGIPKWECCKAAVHHHDVCGPWRIYMQFEWSLDQSTLSTLSSTSWCHNNL